MLRPEYRYRTGSEQLILCHKCGGDHPTINKSWFPFRNDRSDQSEGLSAHITGASSTITAAYFGLFAGFAGSNPQASR